MQLLRDEPAAALPPLEEGVSYARVAGTDLMLSNALVHLVLAHLRLGDVLDCVLAGDRSDSGRVTTG